MAGPKLSDKETLSIVEDMHRKRVESTKNFFTDPELASKVPYDYYDVPLNELIADPTKAPKVDADPVVKAILDFVDRNPDFGKLPPKK